MIKRLARSIRGYWLPTLLSPLCMVGEVAMEVTIPEVLSALIDNGIKASNMNIVVTQSCLLVLYALLSLMFGVASAVFAAKAATGFAKNLRHEMYYHVQDFSFRNIDKFSSASLVTRLTSDVAQIQMAFQMCIRMAIRCPMMLILAFVKARRLSVELSNIYLVVMPIMICLLVGLIPVVFKIFDRGFKLNDRLNTVVQENVHGIRVVKSFVRQDKEEEKFTEVSADSKRTFSKAEKILSLNSPVMMTCVYTCILFISWFGANLVLQSGDNAANGLTIGNLTQMFTYTTQILSALMMFSMVFVMLTMSRTPLRRCNEVLSEQPDLHSPENAVTKVADGSIDFEKVSFRYSEKAKHRALKEVDLHIPSGATVGILGGTGSSKSTLVQLIPRLYDTAKAWSRLAAWMSGTMIWKCSVIMWPWCCKRMCCSPAPSRRTSAGAIPVPQMKSWFTPAS